MYRKKRVSNESFSFHKRKTGSLHCNMSEYNPCQLSSHSFSGRSPFVAIFAVYLFLIKANVVPQFLGFLFCFFFGGGEVEYYKTS